VESLQYLAGKLQLHAPSTFLPHDAVGHYDYWAERDTVALWKQQGKGQLHPSLTFSLSDNFLPKYDICV